MDDIVGILHIKDLFHLINSSKNSFNIKDFLRQPIYVPISKPIDDIFFALKNSKSHVAIVLDDYGGTAGIMTIKDIIEEIVGNIFDEHDDATAELKRIDDFTYEISGIIRLDELVKKLDLNLPVEQFDTVMLFYLAYTTFSHLKTKKAWSPIEAIPSLPLKSQISASSKSNYTSISNSLSSHMQTTQSVHLCHQ